MRSKNQSTTTLPMRSAGEQTLPQTSLWQRVGLMAYSKAETLGFRPGHEFEVWPEAQCELPALIVEEKLAA